LPRAFGPVSATKRERFASDRIFVRRFTENDEHLRACADAVANGTSIADARTRERPTPRGEER
jgi:hypothetical protein